MVLSAMQHGLLDLRRTFETQLLDKRLLLVLFRCASQLGSRSALEQRSLASVVNTC
jgi:hypothetical protein